MTIPSERSRAFDAGLSLLQDLVNPSKTPGVPAEVRERASRVLRHFPSTLDILMVTELADKATDSPLNCAVFDTKQLDQLVKERLARFSSPAARRLDGAPEC